MEDLEVIKRGETCANIRLRRAIGGLNITVSAHKELEAQFRSWGDGTTASIDNYVRKGWIPIGQETISVYHIKKPQGILVGDNQQKYTIDYPGQPILLADPESGHPDRVINMSFLRIAGISDNPVTFTVRGVWTIDAIKDIRNQMQDVIRRFYNSYLRPIDTTLMVYTSIQTIPGQGWVEGRT